MTDNKLISRIQPKSRRSAGGFTLMELLVVIMIIAVLTAIGLVVGGKFLTSANKKKTAANMKLIMHAVNIYQEECDEYPKKNDDDLFFGDDLLNILRYGESSIPGTPDPDYTKDVWEAKIKPIIDKLPDNAFEKDPDTKQATGFIDGFDQLLVFEPAGGLGGTPRLVSAGPDEDFSTEDDIYSDK